MDEPITQTVIALANVLPEGFRLAEEQRNAVLGCRQVVERAMPRFLEILQQKLDDTIFNLAARSGEADFDERYYDDLRFVRAEWDKIAHTFLSRLHHDYNAFWHLEQDPRTRTRLQLSLVDKEVMEDNLALQSISQKAEGRLFRELYLLEKRLSHLGGGVTVDHRTNPLGPSVLCHCFQHGVREVESAPAVRMVLYRLFDLVVVDRLGPLYDKINELLVRFNILPRLAPPESAPTLATPSPAPPPKPQAAAPPAPARPAPPPVPAPSQAPPTEGGGPWGPGLFDNLARLVERKKGPGGPTNLHTPIPTPELVNALSALQADAVSSYSFDDTDFLVSQNVDIKGELERQLSLVQGGLKKKVIGQVDDDTIDIITMLFEFILGDRNIPDDMKVLLIRLQIPLLKTAILDKGFFGSEAHPARSLLNNMASAAMVWSDEGNRADKGLYNKIEAIVNRVLLELKDDVSLFRELDEEFRVYLEKEKRGAAATEDRTTQIVRGREKLQMVKDRVSEEIAIRLEGRSGLPDAIRNLLQDAWKDVLLLVGLRQGMESEEWQAGLELMDRLIWSVNPEVGRSNRQELLRAIPDISRAVRQGLTDISYDPVKMGHIAKDLQNLHIACIRGVGEEIRVEQAEEMLREARRAQREAARAQASRDEFDARAAHLTIGSWLEVVDAQGDKQRVKLAWKSEVSDTRLYVNRKGAMVLEVTAGQLAELLRSRRAVVLEGVDVPLMDRALATIMKSLEETSSDSARR